MHSDCFATKSTLAHHDKIIIKIAMQNGGKLHLALLAKLTSKSHNHYLIKFNSYLTTNTQRQTKHSTLDTSSQLFKKYPSTDRHLSYTKHKSHSLEQKPSSQTTPIHHSQDYADLTAWNAGSQQEFNYSQFVLQNNFELMHEQLPKIKKQPQRCSKPRPQKKYTYCEQDINQFFKHPHAQSAQVSPQKAISRKQRSRKLRPLVADLPKKKQKRQNASNAITPSLFDKQNLLAQELALLCPATAAKFNHQLPIQKSSSWGKGNSYTGSINSKRIC